MAINYLYFTQEDQNNAVKSVVEEHEARHFRLSLNIKQKVEEIKSETDSIERQKLEDARLELVSARKLVARQRQSLIDAYPDLFV